MKKQSFEPIVYCPADGLMYWQSQAPPKCIPVQLCHLKAGLIEANPPIATTLNGPILTLTDGIRTRVVKLPDEFDLAVQNFAQYFSGEITCRESD